MQIMLTYSYEDCHTPDAFKRQGMLLLRLVEYENQHNCCNTHPGAPNTDISTISLFKSFYVVNTNETILISFAIFQFKIIRIVYI